ncbi:MAG TPA: hypothetical protein VLT61_14785 [Anaeromyxobacteraceae bacterium]|nr:hypothetical protein [Anaeromyxobacteraceae bacterium]
MAKSAARSVQTFRVSRDLLRRAAKLDGLKPGEWVRLTVERVARERLAQAEREGAAARIRRAIDAGDWVDDDPRIAEWANRIRHKP